ncbi:hypothetical protein [Mycobacterium sp. Marseille-P9652]|uniref:hypothetical protein n=1 Tax=Mycobacterium sp. Marseille-P9652 TaxID=2654950 RepID=UPI0012E8C026|nr:hypothetical protein [Mycobacterium sp. Marseille-P9652]
MLVSSAEIAGAADAADTIASPASTSPAPPEKEAPDAAVLITTQQVVFGTAVALGGRRQSPRGRFVAAVRRMWVAPAEGSRPRRASSYPKHYGFLEQALMAREMDRL